MQTGETSTTTFSKTRVSYAETNSFSSLIIDYIAKSDSLKDFYNRYPEIDTFQAQLEEKQSQNLDRKTLVAALKNQYKGIRKAPETIGLLAEENTFTVTTGHQLCLFSGPAYFLYKIVSTIKSCSRLSERYPEYNFVPVFWLASEDHDFEEANHFFASADKKIEWESGQGGAVGRMQPMAMETVLEEIKATFGIGYYAAEIEALFRNCYANAKTITEATRKLVHQLFGKYGLVAIDGDDASLKKLVAPYFEKELTKNIAYSEVSKTSEKLGEQYKIQVNPREINLFFLDNQLRERIVYENDTFFVLNTDLQFTQEEIIDLLNKHPEKFSPNVTLRPLYQEVILPNLAYIGGGGELAYWFQLKSMFAAFDVVFPMLMLRNSAVLLSEKAVSKMSAMNLSPDQIFADRFSLETDLVKRASGFILNVDEELNLHQSLFAKLEEKLGQIDPMLRRSVKSAEIRSERMLQTLQKKMIKAEKRQQENILDKVASVFAEVWPAGSLQERKLNFSVFYSRYGVQLIEMLLEQLEPFDFQFSIISEVKS